MVGPTVGTVALPVGPAVGTVAVALGSMDGTGAEALTVGSTIESVGGIEIVGTEAVPLISDSVGKMDTSGLDVGATSDEVVLIGKMLRSPGVLVAGAVGSSETIGIADVDRF